MNEDIMGLLPQSVYKVIADVTPQELTRYVTYGLNVDEENKLEVLTAFSYYETLTDGEKERVRTALASLCVDDILMFIGEYNEKLLECIEDLFDKNIKVIQWIENQMNRFKAMSLVFDLMIAEKAKNGNV